MLSSETRRASAVSGSVKPTSVPAMNEAISVRASTGRPRNSQTSHSGRSSA